MEVLPQVLGLLSQLAIFGLIAWVIVRAMGGRRNAPEGAEIDRATSVRRFFVYGLLLVTLILTAVGVTMVGSTLLTSGWADDEHRSLALGLAFTLVAGPAYVLLLRFARRRLDDDPDERTSLAWAAYLNAALATSLIVSTVAICLFLAGVLRIDTFEWRGIAAAVVWSAVWAIHWFWLRPTYGLTGDLHLAVGSLTGLITALLGLGGLVYVAGDQIYLSIVDDLPPGHVSPEVETWFVALGVGAAVWGWHWFGAYRRAEQTPLWDAYVLLIGTLGGVIASIASAAVIGYWIAVWFVGDPPSNLPSEHFEHVAATAAFFVAGIASWQYHRAVLQTGDAAERSEPDRAYDYLTAAAGLVATVVGATLALVAALEVLSGAITDGSVDVANRVILAVILGFIGAPFWAISWRRVTAQLAADPAVEIGSLTRRLYLIAVFGVGGLTALISLVAVLFVGLDDMLGGGFGATTLDSANVGLALLATVTGVAWYHLGVFRSDRAIAEQFAPAPPPAPPSAAVAPAPTHVVLIVPHDAGLTETIAAATGLDVETWVREDGLPMPAIDTDELIARILSGAGHAMAVVVGPTGADVIPYAT